MHRGWELQPPQMGIVQHSGGDVYMQQVGGWIPAPFPGGFMGPYAPMGPIVEDRVHGGGAALAALRGGGNVMGAQFHEVGGPKMLKENPRVQEEATVHSGVKRVHKISSENVHLYASQIGKGSPGGSGKEPQGGGSKPQASKGGSGSQALERGLSGSGQSGKRKEMDVGLTVKATLGQVG
jgi:hypothetical protein